MTFVKCCILLFFPENMKSLFREEYEAIKSRQVPPSTSVGGDATYTAADDDDLPF